MKSVVALTASLCFVHEGHFLVAATYCWDFLLVLLSIFSRDRT